MCTPFKFLRNISKLANILKNELMSTISESLGSLTFLLTNFPPASLTNNSPENAHFFGNNMDGAFTGIGLNKTNDQLWFINASDEIDYNLNKLVFR